MTTLHEQATALRAQEHAGTEPGLELLTPEMLAVFELIPEGLTTAQIGVRLGISASAVRDRRARAMRKLNLHSTAEIVELVTREARQRARDHKLIVDALRAGAAHWSNGALFIDVDRYPVNPGTSGAPVLDEEARQALTAAIEWDRSSKGRAA